MQQEAIDERGTAAQGAAATTRGPHANPTPTPQILRGRVGFTHFAQQELPNEVKPALPVQK
eukprot:1211292-Pyramimonas_sp.AAC.1